MSEDLKRQRDRYIAFSLAAADLLVEVDSTFKIVKTIGATQALLSGLAAEVKGRDVCDIFATQDRSFARRLLAKAHKTGRIEPCTLHLDQHGDKPLLVNMGACFLPDDDNHTYMTLTVLSDSMVLSDEGRDAQTGLLQSDEYQDFATKLLGGDEGHAPGELKMIRLQGLSGVVRDLPSDQASMLLGEIGSVLRAQALGGTAAARLSEEAFSYIAPIKGDNATPESLSADFQAVTRAAGIADGRINPTVMSLELSTGNLDQDSIAKALAYVLGDFCKPERRPISDLQAGLTAAMAETVQHFDNIRNLIDSDHYTLFYQPVVRLNDRSICHYEALLRFSDGRSPFDTIRMSEQLGLVQDFDLAVARKAIDTLQLRQDITVAINLSGQSVQNDMFREHLRQLVMPFKDLNQHLMFELTESNAVEDMEAASNFLRWLRRSGFRVCLDDFGAGAAAYSYLRRFDVDFVKIDGPFLKDALANPRQRALIRSVSQLCKELNSEVVAEMIETEEMAELCQTMGIGLGQGWLFGRPKAQIEAPKEVINGRRKGFSETWG